MEESDALEISGVETYLGKSAAEDPGNSTITLPPNALTAAPSRPTVN